MHEETGIPARGQRLFGAGTDGLQVRGKRVSKLGFKRRCHSNGVCHRSPLLCGTACYQRLSPGPDKRDWEQFQVGSFRILPGVL